MNERQEFLQYFQSVFTNMVERIEMMTETQVLDALLEVNAARSIYDEEFSERMQALIHTQVQDPPRVLHAEPNTSSDPGKTPESIGKQLTYLRSMQPFLNSVTKLRSQSGAKARSGGSPPHIFDSLEDALKKRLETLNKRS